MKGFVSPIRAILAIACVLGAASPGHATDTSQPLFGASITVHGITYDWGSASDNGSDTRYDTYTASSGGHSLTLTSAWIHPSLATVSGSSPSGSVDGHFSSGTYQDNAWQVDETGSFSQNGQSYTHRQGSGSYSVDLFNGSVISSGSETYTGPSGSYYHSWGSGGSSWTQTSSGSHSSPMSGSTSVQLFGRLYTFTTGSWSSSSSSDSNNWNTSQSSWSDSFTAPGGGTMTVTYSEDSMSGQSVTITGSDPLHGWFGESYTGSFSGFGNLPSSGNGTSPFSNLSSFSLFGTTYVFYSSTSSGIGSSTEEWMDTFYGDQGQPATLSHRTWSQYDEVYDEFGNPTGTYNYVTYSENRVEGWDPHVGSFSWTGPGTSGFDFSTMNWAAIAAPSFGPASLLANDALASFTNGSVISDGTVTDTYAFAGGAVTLRARIKDFDLGLTPATVSVNGAAVGTYTNADGFVINPGATWTVGRVPVERPTPYFLSATSLWVNGTEYQFTVGHDDLTARKDTYAHPGAGTLTLTGTTAAPSTASVRITFFAAEETGGWAAPTFSLPTFAVSLAAPTLGGDAYWIRGRLYARDSANPSLYQAGPTASFTMSTPDGGSTLQIAGSDPRGSFTGTVPASQAGILLVQDHQGAATVPVVPVEPGGTLRLAAGPAPSGYPPALMVADGRIWVFLGTGPDEASPGHPAAYYGSATEPASSPWLMVLRTDGSAATYLDASTGSRSSGTYDTASHLFQTSGPDSGFPMPVFAVDPQDNHRPWDLPEAPENLPDTFLVDGQVWRYRGPDASGAPMYQGYYTGQTLAVGVPDADGHRLVTLTDPIVGNTHGTLNDARGSVRLRDGRVAYSGSYEGQLINPTLNENGLHTIMGDLDVTGNVISMGALSNASATAGTAWQFTDDGTTASLHNTLARDQARWTLNRRETASGTATAPVLDVRSHGSSTLHGTLRVRPGGDIPMGSFTASPQGLGAP